MHDLELARLIQEVTGFEGELRRDPSMPEGVPSKRLMSAAFRIWVAPAHFSEGRAGEYLPLGRPKRKTSFVAGSRAPGQIAAISTTQRSTIWVGS